MEDFVIENEYKKLDEPDSKKAGYWVIIKSVSMNDLILNDANGHQVAKLEERNADLRVWWDNGPKFYVALYAHAVTVISASTESFQLQIKWLNQGGGTLKLDSATDNVSCNDTKRRSVYSFSVEEEMIDAIRKIDTQINNLPIWINCAQ